MPNLTQHLRHSDGVWPLTLVLAYILITYIGGWLLMAHPGFLLPALGVIACGHGMVIAAYLVHDCAHNALFKKTEHNTRLGKWLNWLSGGSYGTYEDLRYKHTRHHVDNADPISFDYRAWRYLPAPAFIPLLLMGVVFFLVIMLADVTRQTPKVLIETEKTLSGGHQQNLSVWRSNHPCAG